MSLTILERDVLIRLHVALGGLIEVPVPSGRIDLLTPTELIEIKRASLWKAGLRQLMVYSPFYPGHQLRLHLFGRMTSSMIDFVRSECASSSVVLSLDESFAFSGSSAVRVPATKGKPEPVAEQFPDASLDARLHHHLTEAIALLQDLGTTSGWIDPDIKMNQSTYPRIRWREDGKVHSRALAEWERADVGDRVRRGRLLKQIHAYLQES